MIYTFDARRGIIQQFCFVIKQQFHNILLKRLSIVPHNQYSFRYETNKSNETKNIYFMSSRQGFNWHVQLETRCY